jgi:hypothetical protein
LLSGATSNSSSSAAALDLLDGSSASVLPTQTHQEGEGDLLGLMPMASPPPLLLLPPPAGTVSIARPVPQFFDQAPPTPLGPPP